MTPIDQQIESIESLAARHYPDDELQRAACHIRLLTERLRTFHAMYQEATKPQPMDFDALRRAGFSVEEIALGSQEIVR